MTPEECFKDILIDKINLILNGEHPFPKNENNDSLLLYSFLDHIKQCFSPEIRADFYIGEIGKEDLNGGFFQLVVTQFEINVALACLLCNQPLHRFVYPNHPAGKPKGKSWFISSRDEISSQMEVKPIKALEWLLYNIKNDYIDIGITKCDMPPANRHDCFVKMQLSLGRLYQNIMSESWQRSY